VGAVAGFAENRTIDLKILAPNQLCAGKWDKIFPTKSDRAGFFPEFNPTLT